MKLLGHEVQTLLDPQLGIDAAVTFEAGAILLDVGMPELDGWTLARNIRRVPSLAGVRLIAVTGYGRGEDRQRSLDAGFDAHLLKPLMLEELAQLLAAAPDGLTH